MKTSYKKLWKILNYLESQVFNGFDVAGNIFHQYPSLSSNIQTEMASMMF